MYERGFDLGLTASFAVIGVLMFRQGIAVVGQADSIMEPVAPKRKQCDNPTMIPWWLSDGQSNVNDNVRYAEKTVGCR